MLDAVICPCQWPTRTLAEGPTRGTDYLTKTARLYLLAVAYLTMRFLLHPVVLKSRTKAVTAVVTQHPHGPTIKSSLPSNKSSSEQTTAAWGQQCSPNCGCVLRFEATKCCETDRILTASYTAKQVLTDAHGRVQLTNRSQRPMMKDCSCPSLHHLATAVVDQYLLHPSMMHWQRLKAQLDFASTRSSPAFAKAVLSSQNLPLQSTGCFDLVEEALTGMVKGYLPKQRRQRRPQVPNNVLTLDVNNEDDDELNDSVRPRVTSSSANASPRDMDFTTFSHYHYHESQQQQQQQQHSPFGFSLFWNQPPPPERQTMLEFVDEQHAKVNMALSTSKKHVPTDWVDYVDRVWQEQEERREGRSQQQQQQSA